MRLSASAPLTVMTSAKKLFHNLKWVPMILHPLGVVNFKWSSWKEVARKPPDGRVSYFRRVLERSQTVIA